MIESIMNAIIESAFGVLASLSYELVVQPKLGTIDKKNVSRHADEPLKLEKINEFWEKNLRDGDYVEIEGTLSPYIPMLIGPPKLKRELHREYRRAIPKEDYMSSKPVVDAYLAFTAGQMVWRLDLNDFPWVFMGLYHCIVRNSILVLVDVDYYKRVVKYYFDRAMNPFAIDVRIRGKVGSVPYSILNTLVESFRVSSRKIRPEILEMRVLIVDGRDDTKIEYIGKSKYLDGDIWVAVEYGGNEFFVSRFVDISDPEDLKMESQNLKNDVQKYLPHGRIIFQFDQVEKLISGYQRITLEELKRRFIGNHLNNGGY